MNQNYNSSLIISGSFNEVDVSNEVAETQDHTSDSTLVSSHITSQRNISEIQNVLEEKPDNDSSASSESCLNIVPESLHTLKMKASKISDITKSEQVIADPIQLVEHVDKGTDNYEYLNASLQRMAIPIEKPNITETRESQLQDSTAYLTNMPQVVESASHDLEKENITPSAPMFEEKQPQVTYQEANIEDREFNLECMSIEEVESVFAGTVMSAVRALSDREEAIVEEGPLTGPEHPLVDLLSTFKSSLCALENERARLTCNVDDEERSRSTLWKVEKLLIYKTKQCKCGSNVELRATYEHAEMQKDRLPVAKLWLEGLLRDIQDSYCHHQHTAMLAYCQW